MTNEERMKNLSVPSRVVDAVLDTDAFNEIDDQFAIAYMLKNKEKINTVALYAAPFYNALSKGPADGMEKSYDEIIKLLSLLKEKKDVYRGSDSYLPDDNTPVISDAAKDLAVRCLNYSPEEPLYVVAIGAITNVASAILIEPKVAENCVVVWLGGHGRDFCDTAEFNMMQDYAAARVVMGSGVPFVQLPCCGVVSSFTISEPELEYWFRGKNPIADYLAVNTENAAHKYAIGKPWTRVIWDVTAVAWLVNDGDKFMRSRIDDVRLPDDNGQLKTESTGIPFRYVYHINRDALMDDLIKKITE